VLPLSKELPREAIRKENRPARDNNPNGGGPMMKKRMAIPTSCTICILDPGILEAIAILAKRHNLGTSMKKKSTPAITMTALSTRTNSRWYQIDLLLGHVQHQLLDVDNPKDLRYVRSVSKSTQKMYDIL
jgi:hypothetical protein